MIHRACLFGIFQFSVCTEELAEYEYECKTDGDIAEEFSSFFLLEDKLKSRERAVFMRGSCSRGNNDNIILALPGAE